MPFAGKEGKERGGGALSLLFGTQCNISCFNGLFCYKHVVYKLVREHPASPLTPTPPLVPLKTIRTKYSLQTPNMAVSMA